MKNAMRKYFPIFVLPTLIACIFACVVPFVMGEVVSWTRFTTVTNAKCVGLQTYIKAFTSDNDF